MQPLPNAVTTTRIAVLGAGLMGHSIAGVFAAAGAEVRLYDPVVEALHSSTERVRAQLHQRGLDPTAADRIQLSTELADTVTDAHLVIEAIPENLALKQSVFAQLYQLNPDAVLATNTSVLRISDVAAQVPDAGRVLGTHWFNPPHLVPLVEVIQSATTDYATVAWLMDLLTQVGKLPVHVRKDVPGFIGNRLQHALWREALHLVEQGVCDAQTLDLVVRNSFGLRLPAMGPIENADYVGLDLTQAVHEYVFPHLCNDTTPSRLVREHVERGELGAKTGSGLLEWPPGRREEATTRLSAHLLRELSATTDDLPSA